MTRMTTAPTKFLIMSYLLTIFLVPIVIFYIVSKMLKGLFTESVFLNINASPTAIHVLKEETSAQWLSELWIAS